MLCRTTDRTLSPRAETPPGTALESLLPLTPHIMVDPRTTAATRWLPLLAVCALPACAISPAEPAIPAPPISFSDSDLTELAGSETRPTEAQDPQDPRRSRDLTLAERYRTPQRPEGRRTRAPRSRRRVNGDSYETNSIVGNQRYSGTPWRDDHPRGKAVFSFGIVNYGEETELASGTTGTELDDDTEAIVSRFQFEGFAHSERGGGVAVEFTSVDSDLHRGDAGITSSDTEMIDIFGYFATQPRSRYFRMPTRVGFYINALEQEDNQDELDWITFGARIEVEPEFDIIQTDELAFSVYGAFAAGFGSTIVDVDSLNEEFYTANARFGVRAGLRLTTGAFTTALSLYHTYSIFAESDEEVIGNQIFVVDELQQSQNGVMFTAGVRW